MGQEPIETTLVAARPLRTRSYPAAVGVRWASTIHVRAAVGVVEPVTKAPQSFPTFLVDGAVAGTWRYENGALELAPFGRLDAAARRELAAESERLAAFHA